MENWGLSARLRRAITGLALIALVVPVTGAADSAVQTIAFSAWTNAGSRVVFQGIIGKKSANWTWRPGARTAKRIVAPFCIGDGKATLAFGPKGSIGCLDLGVGMSEISYDLSVLTSDGKERTVTSIVDSVDENGNVSSSESIPAIFGDGKFLGYLHVSSDGSSVELVQILADGSSRQVAELQDVVSPGEKPIYEAKVDSGHIVIRQGNDVYVYTTSGKHMATISGKAAMRVRSTIAIRKDRVVVLTTGRRINAYTLRGRLVRSYPVRAAQPGDLATYYGFAVYTTSHADSAPVHSTLRVLKLSTGKDRIVTKSGKSWFMSGESIQAPGILVPVTTLRGKQFYTRFRFVAMAKVRAAFAR